ncbi:MAG: hypothetical protein ACI8UO_001485 [Verrucomicrobiales bacterium]|jgi:hypothetical protein
MCAFNLPPFCPVINWTQRDARHNSEIDEKFHQLNVSNIFRVLYWREYFGLMAEIPGDIVECGVGRGRSLVIIAALNRLLKPEEGGGRTLFAYDSFCGFPEPANEDESSRNPKKGEWSHSPSGKYEYSPEFIASVLGEAEVPVDKPDELGFEVTFGKGYFCDSLPSHPDRPIALLHLDGDLYDSYMDSLTNLFDKVSPGGVIVFDDFKLEEEPDEKFPGARRAVKEFFGDAFENMRVSSNGAPYYIKPA